MRGSLIGGPAASASWRLQWDGARPRFLEGALLGNGGLGVVLTTRPDAVVLHLGHNDVWDRRIDEQHRDEVMTFDEVLSQVQGIDPSIGAPENDPWFGDYRARMVRAYAKPYPRPLPCGSLILGIDRRDTEVLGHELDLRSGVCTVQLRHKGQAVSARVHVDQSLDDVHIEVVDGDGEASVASPFVRLRLLPDPDGPAQIDEDTEAGASTFILPKPGEVPNRPGVEEVDLGASGVGFREAMPSMQGFDPPEGWFELHAWFEGQHVAATRPSWYGTTESTSGFLERTLSSGECRHIQLRLQFSYGGLSPDRSSPERAVELHASQQRSLEVWTDYWNKSLIAVSDDYLESIWYRNTYFHRCCARPGGSAPGLFGNWMYRSTGSAWHGDYHMNYNAQQVYWGVFSSNRVEQHEPYISMVERVSREVAIPWARDYYRMRGAAYPHSAYNVPMTVNPYPNPVWAWELSESPWVVQSMWWHFLYTHDREVLKDRLFPLIESVVMFLIDYLDRNQNDQYWQKRAPLRIFPTVAPELYGLSPGLRYNRDCLLDIALIRFLFKAYVECVTTLEIADSELMEPVQRILRDLPGYPRAETPEGEVFVSVPGEDPDIVYNVPVPGMTVFPAEQHSWEDSAEVLDVARRSVRRQRIEGGNDLVFANLQAVRLGDLDIEKFKRHLRYCEAPNGALADMVLQVHGRYNDATAFEFMEAKGIWVENFAITSVVNEMMLQSYSGTIRLFPNMGDIEEASFVSLRARGAFLVTSEYKHGTVGRTRIVSEAGSRLRVLMPWSEGGVVARRGDSGVLPGGIFECDTVPGEEILFSRGDQ